MLLWYSLLMKLIPLLKVFVIALAVASAQQRTNAPSGKVVDTVPSNVSIQGYGDYDKTCRQWTDGCRICRRGGDGAPVCSNIGIACQPQATRCASRSLPK